MQLLCIQIYTFLYKVYEHTSKYKQYDIYGVLNFNLFSRLFQYFGQQITKMYFALWFPRMDTTNLLFCIRQQFRMTITGVS